MADTGPLFQPMTHFPRADHEKESHFRLGVSKKAYNVKCRRKFVSIICGGATARQKWHRISSAVSILHPEMETRNCIWENGSVRRAALKKPAGLGRRACGDAVFIRWQGRPIMKWQWDKMRFWVKPTSSGTKIKKCTHVVSERLWFIASAVHSIFICATNKNIVLCKHVWTVNLYTYRNIIF